MPHLALHLLKKDGGQGAHVVEGFCISFFPKIPCDKRDEGGYGFPPAFMGVGTKTKYVTMFTYETLQL
jgi:hypothetical protein